jgi:flagella basal body P-ring formation protein FlgA
MKIKKQYVIFFTLLFVTFADADITLMFHDSSIVNDTVIRVGDVADFSGVLSKEKEQRLRKIPIGEAAPAGYSRFISSYDIVRRILREKIFGNVANYDNKRLTVKTACIEKCVGDFENNIVAYIKKIAAWNQDDYTIAVVNRSENIKILNRPFTFDIEGFSEKYPRGNVHFRLVVFQDGKRYTLNIACKISVYTSVVIATSTIKRNSRFSSDNCGIEKKDITNLSYIPYSNIHDICNKISSRTITAGTVIHEKLIAKVPDIECNDQVQIIVTTGRIRVCMAAAARESGCCGDKIWVENETTHKLLRVKVLEHGKVALNIGEQTL